MLELAVIADDLTGAADTSVQFSPFLKRVWLFPSAIPSQGKQPSGPAAWGLNTDSRSLSPSEAYLKNKALAQMLLGINPKFVYKKVDSCMRGNVGVEVQAILEVLGNPCAFIAPAYPEMGRITHKGLHLLHGVPVAQSEMGRDPLSPVSSSRLQELAGGSWGIPAAHLDLGFLEPPNKRLFRRVEELVSKGVRHITFDALDMEHLRRIAQAALEVGALPVGSAALAGALAQICFGSAAFSPAKLSMRGSKRHLFVVGSKSERARAQINSLLKEPLVHHLKVPLRHSRKHEKPWEGLFDMGSGCLLLTPEPPQGPRPDPRQITQALAAAAGEITQSWCPQGIFLTGGETAQAVIERLGIRRIGLMGELQRGVVVGRAQDGIRPGLLVLTKAGSFGEEQLMAYVLELLRKGFGQKKGGKGDRTDEASEGAPKELETHTGHFRGRSRRNRP